MSATIFCSPILDKDKSLPVWAPSSFMEQMEKVFGSWPLTLDEAHIPVLKGMAAVSSDGGNPWPELIRMIEDYGSVELFAKW